MLPFLIWGSTNKRQVVTRSIKDFDINAAALNAYVMLVQQRALFQAIFFAQNPYFHV